MTKVLHKAFSNIKSQTIQEVKAIVNEGFYKKNDSEKMKELLALAGKLSNIYKAPWITDLLILRHPLTYFIFGRYDGSNRIIYIRKPSIVTFLHEYRHHLQQCRRAKIVKTIEYDAQAWACSVFYNACPNLFKEAVANNRIMGLKMLKNGEIINQ